MLFVWAALSIQADPPARAKAATPAIKVDLNIYTPGLTPMGIGEPNKVAQEQADQWQAQRKGPRVIFQPTVNTGTSEGEWIKTQLLGGIAPEIIHQNAETVWPDVGKGWFVALDPYLQNPNPYVPGNKHWIDLFGNQALVNAKRAPDGKLYCIPIDIVETGLFYNKTLLHKLGVDTLPTTWAEMLETMEKIRAQGITPMSAPTNLASDWGQDVLFEMVYHDILPQMDLIASPADAQAYLQHYLDPPEAAFLYTKGFFTPRDPRWREMNRLLRQWRTVWAREQKNSNPDRLFLTQRMAFFWRDSCFLRRMVSDPYIDFEWGVTYLPPLTQSSCRFAQGTPATVIGGAAIQLHITNSAVRNGTVADCVDYLMFLTAPRNIEKLCGEALLYIPNTKGAQMDPRLEPFAQIFQRPYCAVKWLDSLDGREKKYWRRMLDYYLNDGMTLDEYLQTLDGNFARWTERHRQDAGWDFSQMEQIWSQRKDALLNELDH